MRRLGGADALLLYLETPRAYMHTLKIAIADPSREPGGWSFEVYAPGDHGTRLFAAAPESMDRVVTFLAANLGS